MEGAAAAAAEGLDGPDTVVDLVGDDDVVVAEADGAGGDHGGGLDGDAAGETAGGSFIGMSNFRVVAMVYESHAFGNNRGTPRACVSSSGRDGGHLT